MARNGSGSYSLPAGNPVTTGTQITASWGNTTLADIAAEITGSIAADGQTTITGPLKGAAGSVSAPSYSFSAETNTGFYKSASNVVSLAIAGSQKYIFGATSVTLAGTAVTTEGLAFAGGTASAANITTLGAEPHTALLTALGAQTTAANNVQAYSGAATPILLSTGTSSGNIPLVGTSSATDTLPGLVELATNAETVTGTDTARATTPAGVKAAIIAALPFTASYTSTPQTITAAGSLTLAHGLGAVPTLMMAWLKCTTAEQGYSIGDQIAVSIGAEYTHGVSVSPDATNLNVRYANSGPFDIIHKTTGAVVAATAGNWSFIVSAWV